MSQPDESTTDRWTAASSRFSVAGLDSVLPGDDPVRQRGHHRLLAHHPVQVAAGQFVALPDEAERLPAAELLRPGRKVGARERFEHRLFEADVHAAERVGDQREPEQPDLGVVVDGHPGELGDGSDQGLPARLGALFGGVLEGVTGCDQAHPLGFPGLAIDAVDLRLAQARRRDVGVPGDRDRGRRLPVVRYPDQDDGVGVRRLLVTGPQGRQLLGGQGVAVRIGAAVEADQQDVDRAVVAALAQRGRGHVEDAVLEGPDVTPRDPGAEDDQNGQRGGNHTNHTVHRHPTRLLVAQPLRG